MNPRCGFVFVLSLLCAQPATCAVMLPALFSDHAVLKRTSDFQLWGAASPGEDIQATVDHATGRAIAGADGRWIVHLDLSGEGEGPYDLLVQGTNRIIVRDVVIGEVWVCSGQSNMEWALQATTHADVEMAHSANRWLRLFLVPKKMAKTPAADCGGHWVVAGPNTVGPFPAVGYYFGERIQQEIGQPVGLIGSSWSGTPCEPWMPVDALDSYPELKQGNEKILQAEQTYPSRLAAYLDDYRTWQVRFQRADRPYSPASFLSAAPGAVGWRIVTLPGSLATQGFPGAGAVWVRRQLRVPRLIRPGIESGAILYLGLIRDFDTVYWDGTEIGHTFPQSPQAGGARRYIIPRRLLHEGEDATLAIRIFAPAGSAAIAASPANFSVGTNIFDPGEIGLAGPWEAKAEFMFDARLPGAAESYPKPPRQPGLAAARIFNGMINPLTRFRISGVVWYQGESNVDRAYQYRKAFPLLISSWRQHWDEGAFPFYFCQIANHGAKVRLPGESTWAELREAQSLALALPNTGQAVLIDLGVASDEHPRNKEEVGYRLARIALAKTYGRSVIFSGPTFVSSRTEPGAIRITFAHTDGGLIAGRPGAVEGPESLAGFAVCGSDRKWRWASARIEGNLVVVWSPAVPAPVAVRYAWAENPTCNLYNGAGLPAAPFRTDNFPLTTVNGRF